MQQLTTIAEENMQWALNDPDKLTSFNPFAAVRDFHTKYGAGVDEELTEDNLSLRLALINEEYEEVWQEFYDQYDWNDFYDKKPEQIDKKALTKELSDLIYVVIGTGVQLGLPLEEVFKRTHYSNMTKSAEKREDGKVLKGENYVPPNLDDLF